MRLVRSLGLIRAERGSLCRQHGAPSPSAGSRPNAFPQTSTQTHTHPKCLDRLVCHRERLDPLGSQHCPAVPHSLSTRCLAHVKSLGAARTTEGRHGGVHAPRARRSSMMGYGHMGVQTLDQPLLSCRVRLSSQTWSGSGAAHSAHTHRGGHCPKGLPVLHATDHEGREIDTEKDHQHGTEDGELRMVRQDQEIH